MTTKTQHYKNGEQVFPCRCGKTHRGEYAQEDWNHHNCLHNVVLKQIGDGQVMCGLCGRAWTLGDAGLRGR